MKSVAWWLAATITSMGGLPAKAGPGEVLGWRNTQTGTFRPASNAAASAASAAAAATVVKGNVRANVYGAITPTLPAGSLIYCEMKLTISAHDDSYAYVYNSYKTQTVPGTNSGSTYSCLVQMGYSANIIVDGTSPQLEIAIGIFAVDPKAPPGLRQDPGGEPVRYLPIADGSQITIPLPPNNNYTVKNFPIVF